MSTLQEILSTPVAIYSSIQSTSAQVLPLKDVLESMKINAKPDWQAFTKEEKVSLRTVTYESSATRRDAGTTAIPNGLVFVDIDEFKKSPNVKELSEPVLDLLRKHKGYIADWQSSSCGIHAVFALSESTIDNLPVAQYQAIKFFDMLDSELQPFGGKVDRAFKSIKQTTFIPRRTPYITNKENIERLDFGYEPPKEVFHPVFNIDYDEAEADDLDKGLLKWTESSCNKILNAHENDHPTNEVFMQVVRDFGRMMKDSEDWLDENLIRECRQRLIDAAVDSEGTFGGGRDRESFIERAFDRHYKSGYENGEAKPLIPYSEFVKDNKEIKAVEPIYLNVEDVYDIDLRNQPKDLMDKSSDELIKIMFDAFLRDYRFISGTNTRQLLNIHNGKVYSPCETRDHLESICWTGVETRVIGKRTISETIEIPLLKALRTHDTDEYYVDLISTYEQPAMKLCKSRIDVESELVKDCFNIRNPLALENKDLNDKCGEKEVEVAKQILDMIVNRFDKEDSPDKCSAYYCKYVCQMITDPAHSPKTAMAFFHKNQGTGKTTLAHEVPAFLLGSPSHSAITKASESNFARGYENKLLNCFEEVTSTNKFIQDDLKRKLDANIITIEKKGKDPVQVLNFVRFTVTSNRPEKFCLDDKNDRRWTIFSIPYVLNGDEIKLASMIKSLTISPDAVYNGYKVNELRLALFQQMTAYYLAYESTHEELSLTKAIETESRDDTFRETQLRDKLIRLALEVIGREDVSLSSNEFLKTIKTRGSDDSSLQDFIWTQKNIRDRLKNSQIFNFVQTDHKGCWWFLTNAGLKMLDDNEKVNYLSKLDKMKDANYYLPANVRSQISDALNNHDLIQISVGDNVIDLGMYKSSQA